MNYETYSLGIDEIRQIISSLEVKDSNRLPIIIQFYIASEEAQNAMLKMLEDYVDSQFIIKVASPDMLLATVRSRLIDVTDLISDIEGANVIESIAKLGIAGNVLIVSQSDEKYIDLVNKYIKLSVADRLKCKGVQAMLDKETATGSKSKDDIHQFLIAIINNIMSIYQNNIKSIKDTSDINSKSFINLKEQINQYTSLAEYMVKPGSSAKLIMDYVAYRLRV